MEEISSWIIGVATIALAGATAALAGIVGWQTKLQKKELEVLNGQLTEMSTQTTFVQSQLEVQVRELNLSHRPHIYPRSIVMGEHPATWLEIGVVNIGRGNAKDVHIQVTDVEEKEIGHVDAYALLSGEGQTTGVRLKNGMKFKMKGYYFDFMNEEYNPPDSIFEFPPKEIKNQKTNAD